jgi:hypothetical protein
MASRAGRKRKTGIKRQPNGQPYRPPVDEREVAVDARMRQHGLSKDEATQVLAGYAIGRMALYGHFGAHYQPAIDAVDAYVNAVADYMRIKHPQMPFPKAMDYLAGKGSSLRPEPSLKTVEKIEKRYAFYVGQEANGRMTGILYRADAPDRMRFHEAAFYDNVRDEKSMEAVKRCVKVLLDA